MLQDQLPLPGQVVQQLKLTVDDRGGGLGAQAPMVRYAVRSTQLVFLARGAGPYTLALGNPTVKAASLPLATLIPDFNPKRLENLGQAQVEDGTLVTAPSAVLTPAPPVTDWKKIGLWAVLLLSVAFLAAMAFSLSRKPSVKS